MQTKAPTAEQVRALRNESGLSADRFGALVGVTGRGVFRWEQGDAKCPASTWELLLIGFGKIKPRRFEIVEK